MSASTTASYCLALRPDGTLWAWGAGGSGQLGNGIGPQNAPSQAGTPGTWSSAAAGFTFAAGVQADGTLRAWGYNASGQLGQGNFTPLATPTQVGAATTWRRLAAGANQVLAVRQDGTLWAWGSNAVGQAGNGGTSNQPAPVQVGVATTWQRVAAGANHCLALRQDGTLWAWGANAGGQLGLGTTSTTNQLTPAQVGITATWQAALAGANVSGALRQDGTLWLWGYNGSGQLAQPFVFAQPLYIANGGAPLAAAAGAARPAWTLAPNPSHGATQLGGLPAGPVQVRLFDGQGRLLRSAATATLATDGLPPGLYLVRATAAGTTQTLRLALE